MKDEIRSHLSYIPATQVPGIKTIQRHTFPSVCFLNISNLIQLTSSRLPQAAGRRSETEAVHESRIKAALEEGSKHLGCSWPDRTS